MIDINHIVILLLLVIAGISNGGMDVLTYNPGKFPFSSDWWHKRGKYAWNKRKWYTKYIFTMVSDGWHFLKFLQLFSLSLVPPILDGANFVNSLLIGLILYSIIGINFEIGYNFIWRNNANN